MKTLEEQLDQKQALRLRILEQFVFSSAYQSMPRAKVLPTVDEYVNYVLNGDVEKETE